MFVELDIVLFVDKRLFACEKKEKMFFFWKWEEEWDLRKKYFAKK